MANYHWLPLTLGVLTLLEFSEGISLSNVQGWREIQEHRDQRIALDDGIAQHTANGQACLRLCWRVTSCQAVSYSYDLQSGVLCRLADQFQSTALVDDVSSVVVDMRRAVLDKNREYGCDRRPCQSSEMCVTIGSKSEYVCLGLGKQNCGTPPNLAHAMVSTDGFSHAFYKCLPGFTTSEPNAMTSYCDEDSATWSDVTASCTDVNCGTPPAVENMNVSFTLTSHASLAYYTCVAGTRPQNHLGMIISCQANGQWTQSPAPCQIVDCGQPTSVTNGEVNLRESVGSALSPAGSLQSPGVDESISSRPRTVFGSRAIHTCRAGYRSTMDAFESTCQEDGQWSTTAAFQCPPVDCDPPPARDLTEVSFSTTTFLSMATYRCADGFLQTDGSATSVCLPDGSWSPANLTCQPVYCGRPGAIPDAFTVVFNKTTFNSKAYLSCREPLAFLSGTDSIHCNASGLWSDVQAQCDTTVSCGPPPDRPHADSSVSKADSGIGYKARYTCHQGYHLTNDRIVVFVCLNGMTQWQGSNLGQCQRISCGQPPEVTHAKVSADDFLFESQAVYTCNNGYRNAQPDAATRTCTNTGQWSSEYIACVENKCWPIPVVDKSVTISIDKSIFQPGEFLSYDCTDNFIHQFSEKSIECFEDGWEKKTIKCISTPCTTDPPLVENSIYKVEENSNAGQVQYYVNYTCNPGFVLEDQQVATRMCIDAANQWSEDKVMCILEGCGQPPDVANAITTFNSTSVGAEVVYKCMQGFAMATMSEVIRKCSTDKTWSQETVTCTLVDCGAPPALDNTDLDFIATTYGSEVTYTCSRGFRFGHEVAPTATCSNDGSWHGLILLQGCSQVLCPDALPSVANAGIRLEDNEDPTKRRYAFGDTVNYDCNEGFVSAPSSSVSKLCNESGLWSGMVECVPGFCSEPTLTNAHFSSVNRSITGRAMFDCYAGHRMVGGILEGSIICESTLTWSTPASECTLVNCLQPPDVEHAMASFHATTLGSIVTYVCNDLFEMKGNTNQRHCLESGSWSSGNVQCGSVDEVRCPEPPLVANSTASYKSRTPGDVTFYACNLGFEHWWFESRICTESGDWSDEKISCQHLDCGSPPPLANGLVHFDATTLGSMAVYRCETDFIFVSPQSTRVCLDDGNWSKHHIECETANVTTCLQPPIKANAELKISSLITYGTAYYDCDNGFEILIPHHAPLPGMGIVCKSGAWFTSDNMDVEDIQCLPKDCGKPPSVAESVLNYSSTLIGGIVEYQCQKGHSIATESTKRCQLDGSWSTETVECILDTLPRCPYPPERPSSFQRYSSHSVGSTVFYICEDGYSGDRGEFICASHGAWEEVKSEDCKSIDCHEPPVLSNLDIHYRATTKGNLALYTCASVHHQNDRPMRSECLNNGSWSIVPDQCQICPLPPSEVINAHLISVSNSVGGQALFDCLDGYFVSDTTILKPGISRTCLETGLWSDQDGGCVPAWNCTNPPHINNAVLSETIISDDGKKFVYYYRCLEGFYMLTDYDNNTKKRMICQEDTGWKNTIIECVLVDCGVPIAVENTIILVNATTFKSVAEYDCHIWGRHQQSVCQSDGTWSPVDIACPRCDLNDAVIRNGHLVTLAIDGWFHWSTASVQCDEATQLILVNRSRENIVHCEMDTTGRVFWSDLNGIHCLQTFWQDPPMDFSVPVLIPDYFAFFSTCFSGTPNNTFTLRLLAQMEAGMTPLEAQAVRVEFQRSQIAATQVNFDGTQANVVTALYPEGFQHTSTICVKVNVQKVAYEGFFFKESQVQREISSSNLYNDFENIYRFSVTAPAFSKWLGKKTRINQLKP